MRQMILMLSVLSLSVLSIASAACSVDLRGEGIVLREEKRFVVNGPADVSLRTFDGSIQLKSWDRNEVLVEMERRGPDEQSAKSLVVNTSQEGNRIVVDVPAPPDRREGIHIGSSRSPSISLVVTAPRMVTVDARTGDGSITADDLAGTVTLNSADGSIRTRRLEGTLRRDWEGTGDLSTEDLRVSMKRYRSFLEGLLGLEP